MTRRWLQQLPTGGKIEHEPRLGHPQAFKVDDVEVGDKARRHDATVRTQPLAVARHWRDAVPTGSFGRPCAIPRQYESNVVGKLASQIMSTWAPPALRPETVSGSAASRRLRQSCRRSSCGLASTATPSHRRSRSSKSAPRRALPSVLPGRRCCRRARLVVGRINELVTRSRISKPRGNPARIRVRSAASDRVAPSSRSASPSREREVSSPEAGSPRFGDRGARRCRGPAPAPAFEAFVEPVAITACIFRSPTPSARPKATPNGRCDARVIAKASPYRSRIPDRRRPPEARPADLAERAMPTSSSAWRRSRSASARPGWFGG